MSSTSTTTVLVVLAAAVCLTVGHPEEVSDPQTMDEAAAESAESGEHLATTDRHLDLEDPASWSASTEVMDENHAWYRRRRSADLEVAESVVFNPHFLRVKKRVAHEECRVRNDEYTLWSRHTRHTGHPPTGRTVCNGYCCYTLAPEPALL